MIATCYPQALDKPDALSTEMNCLFRLLCRDPHRGITDGDGRRPTIPLQEHVMKSSYIKLTGFVTKEPELRTSTKGDAVCTIRLGVTDRFLHRETGEWRESEPSYYDVTCWRRLAENVVFSLRKGERITIHGTCRNKVWVDRNNNPRVELEITANSVGHDMLFSISRALRAAGPQQRPGEGPDGGEASRQGLEAGQGPEPGGLGAGFGDPLAGIGPGQFNAGQFDDAGEFGASPFGGGDDDGTGEEDSGDTGEAPAVPSAPGDDDHERLPAGDQVMAL
jgi:single-strand DNA-binding protein